MRVVRFFLFLAVLPLFLWAQNGKINGRVLEKYKSRPIQGVQVKLIPSNRTTQTDSSGAFVLGKLAAGEYSVIFTKLGYLQRVLPSVKVAADSTVTLRIELDRVPPPVRDKFKAPGQRIRPRIKPDKAKH